MRTLTEKVETLMEFIGTDCNEDRQAIIALIKEQDRDTRRLCKAERYLQEASEHLAIISKESHDICNNSKALRDTDA
jgi:hypothetical protein